MSYLSKKYSVLTIIKIEPHHFHHSRKNSVLSCNSVSSLAKKRYLRKVGIPLFHTHSAQKKLQVFRKHRFGRRLQYFHEGAATS
jgi:hypothetical protein